MSKEKKQSSLNLLEVLPEDIRTIIYDEIEDDALLGKLASTSRFFYSNILWRYHKIYCDYVGSEETFIDTTNYYEKYKNAREDARVGAEMLYTLFFHSKIEKLESEITDFIEIFYEFKKRVDYIRKAAPEKKLLPVIRELIPILKQNDDPEYRKLQPLHLSFMQYLEPLNLNAYIRYLEIPVVHFLILIQEFSCANIFIEMGADLSVKNKLKFIKNPDKDICIYGLLFMYQSELDDATPIFNWLIKNNVKGEPDVVLGCCYDFKVNKEDFLTCLKTFDGPKIFKLIELLTSKSIPSRFMKNQLVSFPIRIQFLKWTNEFLQDTSQKNQMLLQEDSEQIHKLNDILNQEKAFKRLQINFENAISNFNNQLEEISKAYFPNTNTSISLILKKSFHQFIYGIRFSVSPSDNTFKWFFNNRDDHFSPDMFAVNWDQLLEFLVPEIQEYLQEEPNEGMLEWMLKEILTGLFKEKKTLQEIIGAEKTKLEVFCLN